MCKEECVAKDLLSPVSVRIGHGSTVGSQKSERTMRSKCHDQLANCPVQMLWLGEEHRRTALAHPKTQCYLAFSPGQQDPALSLTKGFSEDITRFTKSFNRCLFFVTL